MIETPARIASPRAVVITLTLVAAGILCWSILAVASPTAADDRIVARGADFQALVMTPSAPTAAPSSAVDVTLSYDASDTTVTGLGFRLHFDSSQLALTSLPEFLNVGLIASPQLQADPPNGGGLDADPATDTLLLWAWADLPAPLGTGNGWPNLSLPRELYTATFVTSPGFTGTTLRVTLADGQAAFAFMVPAPLTIALAGGGPTPTPTPSPVPTPHFGNVLVFSDFEEGDFSEWAGVVDAAPGHSLSVSSAAALGSSSSNECLILGAGCGLDIEVADPAQEPHSPAFLAAPFTNETTLGGSFFVNAENLFFPELADAEAIPLFWFLEGTDDGSQIKMIFLLLRYQPADLWMLAPLHYDATLPGFVITGVAILGDADDPAQATSRIVFRWQNGNPGRLLLWRTNCTGGPCSGSTDLILDVPVPGQAGTTINHVLVGPAGDLGLPAGTTGNVYLDEILITE